MIEFLHSPWADYFDFLINQATSSLLISSPYIGREPCKRILANRSNKEDANQLSILLVTDLSRDTLLSGATDVSAICDMENILGRSGNMLSEPPSNILKEPGKLSLGAAYGILIRFDHSDTVLKPYTSGNSGDMILISWLQDREG